MNLRVLKFAAVGGLPAVVIGSFLLSVFDKKSLTRPILIIVGVTVVISAAATFWRSVRQAGVASKPVPEKWLPWIVAPIGFEVGFSSAGAGALGTVALMRFTRLLPSEVVGTDLAFGLLLSIFAGGIHASMNGVPWAIFVQAAGRGNSGGADWDAAYFGAVSSEDAARALCLADLYRGTAFVAGFSGLVEEGGPGARLGGSSATGRSKKSYLPL